MKKINEADAKFRNPDGTGPKYLFRGPNLDWGVMVLAEGQVMGAHGHDHTEETFFFLEGEGEFFVNDQPHPYKPGDAFYVEPKEKHDVAAKTRTRVVFIKHPYDPDDKITY
ncbi:MAG: hypothetical protein Kow0069_00330 [Promethearchaeota archaeon]